MQRSIRSTGPESSEETYRRIAVFTEHPEQLDEIARILRKVASYDTQEVWVWAGVRRFRAPSGTPPAYRAMAFQEARSITEERITTAAAAVERASRGWAAAGWSTTTEVIVDATPAAILERLSRHQIGLLISDAVSPLWSTPDLAERVTSEAGCALLLAPPSADVTNAKADERSRGGLLHRALHG